MRQKKGIPFLWIASAAHPVVDCAGISCVLLYAVIRMADPQDAMLLVIFYNACAFALPMLIGALSDLAGGELPLTAAGLLLVACAFFTRRLPLLCTLLAGVGNGMFHVGCGRRILRMEEGSFAPSGIFISFGTLGVYFGWRLQRFARILPVVFPILLFLFVLLFLFTSEPSAPDGRHPKKRVPGAWICVLLLFLTVLLRSLFGCTSQFAWNNGAFLPFLSVLCVFAGKFFGGIFADRIGAGKTAGISLLLAAVCVLFSADSPLLGCAALFFFNQTMPLTLCAMHRFLPEFPGFSFGAPMLALFLGTLPTMAFGMPSEARPLFLFAVCTLSLALLLFPMLRLNGREKP